MKHCAQKILTLTIILTNSMQAACLLKCCISKTKQEAIAPAENENTADKRNHNTPRDIRIHLNRTENYRKYLSSHELAEWTLEKSIKTDTCIDIHAEGIKNSRDTRPITWQSWQIEGKSPGTSILIAKKIVNKKMVEQEQITVTVIE